MAVTCEPIDLLEDVADVAGGIGGDDQRLEAPLGGGDGGGGSAGGLAHTALAGEEHELVRCHGWFPSCGVPPSLWLHSAICWKLG